MFEYKVSNTRAITRIIVTKWKDCLRFVIVCKRTHGRKTSNHDFKV